MGSNTFAQPRHNTCSESNYIQAHVPRRVAHPLGCIWTSRGASPDCNFEKTNTKLTRWLTDRALNSINCQQLPPATSALDHDHMGSRDWCCIGAVLFRIPPWMPSTGSFKQALIAPGLTEAKRVCCLCKCSKRLGNVSGTEVLQLFPTKRIQYEMRCASDPVPA